MSKPIKVLWGLLLVALSLTTLPASANPFKGKLVLRLICQVEASQRPQIVKRRALLEEQNYRVARDGSWLVYPEIPAAGYRVEVGNQTAFTDANGWFSLPGSAQGGGFFSHPSDRVWRAPFQMAPGPKIFIWPVGRSMKGSPMSGHACVVAFGGPDPRVAAAGQFHGAAVPTAVRTGPRGTYPEPEKPLDCLQDDGPFNTGEPALDYFGSTCDAYVRAGVCVNEWPQSDWEWNLLRPIAQAANILGDGEFLRPAVAPARKFHCSDNHKGRACQQIQLGDISVDVNGSITKAGGSTTIEVEGGQTVRLTVHNNGATGQTDILKTGDELGGTLGGANPLLHYDMEGAGSFHYRPDREIAYQSPVGKKGTDTYLFQTEGRTVEVSFRSKEKPDPPLPQARDGEVILRLRATLTVKSQGGDRSHQVQDEIRFVGNDNIAFRVRDVQPTSVWLEETSNQFSCTVEGGGTETFVQPARTDSWSYHPYHPKIKGYPRLSMKGNGTGVLIPDIAWTMTDRRSSGPSGRAAVDAYEIANGFQAGDKDHIPFTFIPNKASIVKGSKTYPYHYQGAQYSYTGELKVEFTLSIGKLRPR